jgi:predicted RNA-binding protein with RPS1 domain
MKINKNIQIADDWFTVLHLLESKQSNDFAVKGYNRGGLKVVVTQNLTGFIPFSQLKEKRLPTGSRKDPETLEAVGIAMVGRYIKARVTHVDVPAKCIILSERATILEKAIKHIEKGQVFKAVIRTVNPAYGAFVSILGDDFDGVDGLVPNSELSWNAISDPRSVVQQGQEVHVKVINIDRLRLRIILSIKALSNDPVFETLEQILPIDGINSINENEIDMLPESNKGLDLICKELLLEPEIVAVLPGRREKEKRVVTQDLELWMTNKKIENGYRFVARAGKMLQEVHVITKLSRDEIKELVKNVLKRIH